jgi:hypothetical protein
MLFEDVKKAGDSQGFDRIDIIERCRFKLEKTLIGKKADELVNANEPHKNGKGEITIKCRTDTVVIEHKYDSLRMRLSSTGSRLIGGKFCKDIQHEIGRQ